MSEFHVIVATAVVFAMWCLFRYDQMRHYLDKPEYVTDWFPSISLTYRADEKRCHVSRVKLLKKTHELDPDYIEFGREGLFGRRFVDFVLEKKTTKTCIPTSFNGTVTTETKSEYLRKRYYFKPDEIAFFWPDITRCRDLMFWDDVLTSVACMEFGTTIFRTTEWSEAYSIAPINSAMPHLVEKVREMFVAMAKT